MMNTATGMCVARRFVLAYVTLVLVGSASARDLNEAKASQPVDSNSTASETNGTGIEGTSERQVPLNVVDEGRFVRGTSRYILAFFLLWILPGGILLSIAVGLLGWRWAVQTRGFFPIALFWLLAGSWGAIMCFIYTFRIIGSVWQLYSATGENVLYALNFLGAGSFGVSVYCVVQFVGVRLKGPQIRLIKGSSEETVFSADCKLECPTEGRSAEVLEIAASKRYPWNSSGIVVPDDVAIAASQNGTALFAQLGLLLVHKRNNHFRFTLVKARSIRLLEVESGRAIEEGALVLRFVLRIAFLRTLTVAAVYKLGCEHSIPHQFDAFLRNIRIHKDIDLAIRSIADELPMYEEHIEKEARFQLMLNHPEQMAYATQLRLLPRTFARGEMVEKMSRTDYCPGFITHIPMLLVYQIGLDIKVAEGDISEKGRDHTYPVAYFVKDLADRAWFLLGIWGLGDHLSNLRDLSETAGSWIDSCPKESLRKLTCSWRKLSLQVVASSSDTSRDFINGSLRVESIAKVDSLMQQEE